MFGQILNARGRFGAMMWTPVLTNVVLIFTFVAYMWVAPNVHDAGRLSDADIRLLSISRTVAMAVQALALLPYLRAVGFRYRPRFDWRGHGLGKAVSLAKWTLLFVLASQAGLWVVTKYASAIDYKHQYEGIGFAAYQNANLIWVLPQGIITVSIITALLPKMSRAAARGDVPSVREDLSTACGSPGSASCRRRSCSWHSGRR